MPQRKFVLVDLRTRLDRVRWAAVLSITFLVSAWEITARLFFPSLGWAGAGVTILLTLLVANTAAVFMVRVVQALESQIEKRGRELAALNAIIETASRSLDLEWVAEGVLEELARAMEMEVGLIMLRGQSKDSPPQVYHRGLDLSFARQLEQGGILERLYQAGPRLGNTLLLAPPYRTQMELAQEIVQSQGPTALFLFPITSKALVLGMIGVGSYKAKGLTSAEASLLSATGHQIGPAVENAWLYESGKEREKRLAALARASAAISAPLELRQVLQVITQEAATVFGVPATALLLPDDMGEKFVIVAHRGLPAEYVRNQAILQENGVTELMDGNPVALPGSPEAAQIIEKQGLSTFLSVPIVSGGELAGILNLYSFGRRREYLTEELEWARSFASQAGIAMEHARLLSELKDLNIQVITAMATMVEMRDQYSQGQAERVAELAVDLGERVGMSPPDIENLQIAALLHDIGRIHIPGQVLNKPGPLTAQEWEQVRAHPGFSADVVKKLKPLAPSLPIILHHQERYDGQGYPDGLKGEEIPMGARILGVVDAYIAMISPRPYRAALSQEQAVNQLRQGAGSQFDPYIVEEFLTLIQEEGG